MDNAWLTAMHQYIPNFDQKSVFAFDMDGTLTATLSGKMCANEPNDVFLLPNTVKYLTMLKIAGKRLTLWTNQGGVAFGCMSVKTAWAILLQVDAMYGGMFDAIHVNFYHEKGRLRDLFVDKAKPNPVMLQHICREFGVQPEDCVAVGNAFTDQRSAEAAGVSFVFADTFFGWPKQFIVQDDHGIMISPEKLDAFKVAAMRTLQGGGHVGHVVRNS